MRRSWLLFAFFSIGAFFSVAEAQKNHVAIGRTKGSR